MKLLVNVTIGIALAAAAVPGLAQQPPAAAPAAPQPPANPARRPAFALALEAAQAANAACAAQRQHTVALVVDAAGVPVVLLSSDGAVPVAAELAARKAMAVIHFHQASSVVAARAARNPAVAAEVKADPRIGFALGGALPMMAGTEQIGAISVSGGTGPMGDDGCAHVGLQKVEARLK